MYGLIARSLASSQIAVWAGVLALGVAVSDAAEAFLGTTDDPRIVIDEFVGFWTAMLFLPRSLSELTRKPYQLRHHVVSCRVA